MGAVHTNPGLKLAEYSCPHFQRQAVNRKQNNPLTGSQCLLYMLLALYLHVLLHLVIVPPPGIDGIENCLAGFLEITFEQRLSFGLTHLWKTQLKVASGSVDPASSQLHCQKPKGAAKLHLPLEWQQESQPGQADSQPQQPEFRMIQVSGKLRFLYQNDKPVYWKNYRIF